MLILFHCEFSDYFQPFDYLAQYYIVKIHIFHVHFPVPLAACEGRSRIFDLRNGRLIYVSTFYLTYFRFIKDCT